MVQIDGSHGEGGGQILRTAVSLAALTGQPLEIVNIRAKRERPGLQPQHLAAVEAAAAICDAELKGAAKGSVFLSFTPRGSVQHGNYRFDIGTAGATSLVAQTVIVPLAVAEGDSEVEIIGGTHNPMAPTFEYLREVYVPALGQVGLRVEAEIEQAGYYPAGGGIIRLRIPGRQSPSAAEFLSRGEGKCHVHVVTSALPEHVAQRGKRRLEGALDASSRFELKDRPAHSAGAAITIVHKTEKGVPAGFSSLGKRGKRMEEVAEDALRDYQRWTARAEACDEHIADQLVLPLALAKGTSRWNTVEVTEHLRTVLWLTKHFLPIEYELEEREDGSGTVTLIA